LFKTYGPEHPGRVLHETEVVQYPDALFLEVFLSPEIVHQDSVMSLVEFYGQGVDNEISSVEVHFEGTGLYNGGGSRGFIILHAGGGHVHFETVGKNENGCAEFFMASDPDFMVF